jgi:hypothetical protein
MKQIKRFLIGAVLAALCVTASSCSNAFNDATGATSSSGGPPSVKQGPVTETGGDFVAVTGIAGVPVTAYVGTDRTLGTASPANATNRSIVWTVPNDGGTGVTIDGGVLKTGSLNGGETNYTGGVTVTVRATIANGAAQGTPYTEDFGITVYGRPQYGIQLTPDSKDFADAVENNYSNITGQIVTITNIGEEETGDLTLTLSDTTNFTLSTASISNIATTGGQAQFTITPNNSLPAAEYTATVIVGGGNIGGGQAEAQRTFNVSFEVVEADYTITLVNNSGDAEIVDPHTFTAQNYNYSSQGGNALTVKVTNTGNVATGVITVNGQTSNFVIGSNTWFSAGLAPEASNTFTIYPNTGLGADTYEPTITVSNANGGSETFNVSFTVNKANMTGTLSITPAYYASGIGYNINTSLSPTPASYTLYYKQGNQSVPADNNFSDWTSVAGATGNITLMDGFSYTLAAVASGGTNYNDKVSAALAVSCVADTSINMATGQTGYVRGGGWLYYNDVYTIQNSADVTVTGDNSGSARRLAVAASATGVAITLDGATIQNTTNGHIPLALGNNAAATLTVTNTNNLRGGNKASGIAVGPGADLTITGNGMVSASIYSGDNTAAISVPNGSALTITGSVRVNAQGVVSGAGIGSGWNTTCGTITIENNAQVTATGGNNAAGIGSGYQSPGGSVTIKDSAQVTASSNVRAIGAGANPFGPELVHGSQSVTGNYTWEYSTNADGSSPVNGGSTYSFNADHKWVRITY